MIKITTVKNKKRVDEVVEIHLQSFPGFFLTFLGKGFLKQLYKGFIEYEGSGLIVAVNKENQIVGFLAYSDNLSGFYKYLVKHHLVSFAWYAGLGFLKNPRIFFRLFRALSYSKEAKRGEAYVELSSIGVLPEMEGNGIGSKLILALKSKVVSNKYMYIKLETDAEHNEGANCFYQKNGFLLDHMYETHEGRKMNEYRYYL